MTCRYSLFASILAVAIAPLAAQDRTIDLLRQLTDTSGAPGFEEPIRKVMVEQMKPYAASIAFDGLGSIIATQGTQGPRVMVDAHMDEAGRHRPARHAARVVDDADARRLAGPGAGRSALDHRRVEGTGARGHRHP